MQVMFYDMKKILTTMSLVFERMRNFLKIIVFGLTVIEEGESIRFSNRFFKDDFFESQLINHQLANQLIIIIKVKEKFKQSDGLTEGTTFHHFFRE